MTATLPPRFDYALTVASTTDGDTIRGHLRRELAIDLDDEFTDTVVRASRDPRGVPIRLLWVDTPEIQDVDGWRRARSDTASWLGAWEYAGLRVETFGHERRGGRLLGDVYAGERGNSLSQWLIRDRGWLPYTAKGA